MATYLDVFSAVKRGVCVVPDLAMELYEEETVINQALDVLCRAGVMARSEQKAHTVIDLCTDAGDEATATKKARTHGLELRADIPGSQPRVSMFPGKR